MLESLPSSKVQYIFCSGGLEARTPRPGVSIPAVTTRLERTKHDMRKGRNTGSPVSDV